MPDIIPRLHPRTACQVPIQYAPLNSAQFQPAIACDYSAEGFCYEIPQSLDPESEVCILMDNYAPGQTGPEAYRSYVARIRWTHLISENGSKKYAAGAQIVARSHEMLHQIECQLPECRCDLCGKLESGQMMKKCDSGVDLCCSCMKHFSNIPSEKIRCCVERFLLGNVI